MIIYIPQSLVSFWFVSFLKSHHWRREGTLRCGSWNRLLSTLMTIHGLSSTDGSDSGTSAHGSDIRMRQTHMCHGQARRVFFGMVNSSHLENDGILISWGPVNPYGIGWMSLSPITWKCHGSWSTLAHRERLEVEDERPKNKQRYSGCLRHWWLLT